MEAVASSSSQDIAAIQDEDILNKMLDKAVDFEERRMLRAALRELLKKKREKREKERGSRQEDLRQLNQRGAVGSSTSQQPKPKVSPIQMSFNCPPNKTASSADSSAKSPTATAPNTKNVKQMLLDWCRAKTEPYEGVNIKNFSSSWSDGIAFCALVHRFFPDSFEYFTLDPTKRRDNFELAFTTAEKMAGCPPLLDVEDLLHMAEPDWKCVYTYIQEFYRCLVEKGLVKIKKRP
ncbi:Smoothelin-like protein 1 [Merluccius polli]|uniref:Smoothelin-like protein 1 n=1 Tax=Merluccius polli TaxID=89951 RepID=A0AA47MWI5_MERPO|nr:Smoothelin-like protein 1 [Merluccius polli]